MWCLFLFFFIFSPLISFSESCSTVPHLIIYFSAGQTRSNNRNSVILLPQSFQVVMTRWLHGLKGTKWIKHKLHSVWFHVIKHRRAGHLTICDLCAYKCMTVSIMKPSMRYFWRSEDVVVLSIGDRDGAFTFQGNKYTVYCKKYFLFSLDISLLYWKLKKKVFRISYGKNKILCGLFSRCSTFLLQSKHMQFRWIGVSGSESVYPSAID